MNPDLSPNGLAPIVSTQALTKRYRNNFVVNQANLSVMPGDVFGLLGPNGAGKTTIIRMLLGLVKPTSGRAILFGDDIATGRKMILGKTSAIVEAPALYPHLSGWDNMKVMSYSAGITDIPKMRQALSQMGMLERANDKFQTYSLGMKQRLCIAAALMTDPQLIILDEPTNGLDPAGIQSIRELIKSLAGKGRTVFLSSHLLNEVQQVCNRVAIIERGTIIAQGLVEEMLASHNFIQLRVQPDEFGPAVKVLQELEFGRSAHSFGEYLVVDGAANRGGEINRVLGQAGIYPSEIIPRHLSLEEYFLSVTNRPTMPPPGYPNQPPPGYPNQPPSGYASQPPFGYSNQPPPGYANPTYAAPPPGYPYHTPMPPQPYAGPPPGPLFGYPTQPFTPSPGYPTQPLGGGPAPAGETTVPEQGGPDHV